MKFRAVPVATRKTAEVGAFSPRCLGRGFPRRHELFVSLSALPQNQTRHCTCVKTLKRLLLWNWSKLESFHRMSSDEEKKRPRLSFFFSSFMSPGNDCPLPNIPTYCIADCILCPNGMFYLLSPLYKFRRFLLYVVYVSSIGLCLSLDTITAVKRCEKICRNLSSFS